MRRSVLVVIAMLSVWAGRSRRPGTSGRVLTSSPATQPVSHADRPARPKPLRFLLVDAAGVDRTRLARRQGNRHDGADDAARLAQLGLGGLHHPARPLGADRPALAPERADGLDPPPRPQPRAHGDLGRGRPLPAERSRCCRGRRAVATFPAAIGTPSTPTPTGRFSVTDLVATGDPSGPFGWYAFGLSGHQPNLPAGWGGGDQLAIHGTNAPSSIGTAASAGCLRVSAGALSVLKAQLRLGTPVVIQP